MAINVNSLRDLVDNVLQAELSQDVRRGMERATRRAVRDYFMDTFAIERWGPIAKGGFPPDVAARM